jgi:hypothetical protein
MAVGERYWFGHQLAGGHDDVEWDFSMNVPDDRPAQEILDDYAAAGDDSDAVIRTAAGPSAPTERSVHDGPQTLRWVLAHMTSETARHAGHADIIRELIDGTTGR